MNRTAAGEAQRQVTLAKTMYARLVEKNRKAEYKYLMKLKNLMATHAALQEAESK